MTSFPLHFSHITSHLLNLAPFYLEDWGSVSSETLVTTNQIAQFHNSKGDNMEV
jgi:hypothetical protein